jgi:hypothetical protein
MKNTIQKKTVLSLLVLAFCCIASIEGLSQNRYNGVVRDYGNYCNVGTGNVKVFTLGAGNSLVNATGLSGCDGITVSGNTVTPNAGKYFCFTGAQTSYYVQLGPSVAFKWLAENLRAAEGIYNITEFGAASTTNTASVNNTYPIMNALVYIGSRPESGGKLIIPNGVFKVDSGSNPPTKPSTVNVTLPLLIPPGLNIEGVSSKINFPSSRIQVDVDNKTIFQIGGCTDNIDMNDIGLVTPLSLVGGVYQYRPGTKAIYANGVAPFSSQHIVFNRIGIQGFEHGIQVLSGGDGTWQFDLVKVKESNISSCLYPIRINTYNTDWQISNTFLGSSNNSDNTIRGIGLFIERTGIMSIDNLFGGAPKIAGSITNRTLRPEAFIKITGDHANINIRGSQAEEFDHNLLYTFSNPFVDTEKFSLYLEGNGFGDPVTIKGNVSIVSVSNTYLANTFQVLGTNYGGNSTATQIYSNGDTFSGVTYQRQICTAVGGGPLPYGLIYTIAPPDDCRRDFYLYNSPGEANVVVSKTNQRRSGANDSSGLDTNRVQSPFKIASPTVYDPGTPSGDKFKDWGYQLRRSLSDGYLEFEGNQKPPEFPYNASAFRFFGSMYPSADAQFELGNQNFRWSLIRGVSIVSGDTILSDKVTGKELYRIHEDENFIYFTDIRTGKELMRLDTEGNMFLPGKVFENGQTKVTKEANPKQ